MEVVFGTYFPAMDTTRRIFASIIRSLASFARFMTFSSLERSSSVSDSPLH